MTDKKDEPNYQSPTYGKLQPLRQIVHDVDCGETALKAAGKTYLPQFSLEGEDGYKARLDKATTFPALSKTKAGMVGMVFRKNPVLAGDAKSIKQAWENIDNAGTHGDVFIREVFDDFLADGYAFIVVDFPQADPNVTSLAAEKESGRRPYWISYEADQAVNWSFSVINHKRTLEQITFRECTNERTGKFIEEEVVRYRVWSLRANEGELGTTYQAVWELYREIVDPEDKSKKKIVPDPDNASGETKLSTLPVVVIGEIGDEPPLLDLARLNIRYRQQDTDYQKGLTYAGLVIPWARNLDDDETKKKTIGWDVLVKVQDNGEFGLAETTGAALTAHKIALDDLKKDMADIGLSFLVKRSEAQKTATQTSTESTQETSELASRARSLTDGVERAFQIQAMYLGEQSSGSIDLGASLQELTLTADDMNFYLNAEDKGKISLETFWKILDRAGKLPPDFNATTERKQLTGVDVIPPVTQ